MKNFVSYDKVELKNGFWLDRYNLNKEVSIPAVQARFEDTGRFEAMRFTHGKDSPRLHIFYDSDTAKWMEAVAYLSQKDREGMHKYEAFCDALIDSMEKHQRADGYLNSYFQQVASDKIYSCRDWHELYCAGHLLEGAIAYAQATGKDKFLNVMKRVMECIYNNFIVEKKANFITPGHEEIELALFRLYEYTGEEKYKEMAEFFLKNRGNNDKDITIYPNAPKGSQDDVDIYNLKEANGHSVRALYLYSGIADMARTENDEKLIANLDSVWDDIVNRKMYITGEVGSTFRNESFTVAYDLPNMTAYAESCCAIAFIMFSQRMRKIRKCARYGDITERIMYNSLLSSTSLNGKAFFYENPLEIALEELNREQSRDPKDRERLPIRQRLEVFGCSCCPPNINRIFGRFMDNICFEDECCLAVEQYIPSVVNSAYGKIEIDGDYIKDGKMIISSNDYNKEYISLRIPSWCKNYTVWLDGKKVEVEQKDGYVCVKVGQKFAINVEFEIECKFVKSNPKVRANAGRVALMRGPVVYCLEGVDNGDRLNRIAVDIDEAKSAKVYKDDFTGLYSVDMKGYKETDDDRLYYDADETAYNEVTLKFIPYYAFANRGESDMLVWVRRK